MPLFLSRLFGGAQATQEVLKMVGSGIDKAIYTKQAKHTLSLIHI